MICGVCGKPMHFGEFRMEQHSIDNNSYNAYPVASWYKEGQKFCETSLNITPGFYCSECGVLVGIFRYTKPVGFIGRFAENLDDDIDILPKKVCPECSAEMDIDYPRCPECGLVFETK